MGFKEKSWFNGDELDIYLEKMVIKLDLMGVHGDFHGNSLEIHGISWWFP